MIVLMVTRMFLSFHFCRCNRMQLVMIQESCYQRQCRGWFVGEETCGCVEDFCVLLFSVCLGLDILLDLFCHSFHCVWKYLCASRGHLCHVCVVHGLCYYNQTSRRDPLFCTVHDGFRFVVPFLIFLNH